MDADDDDGSLVLVNNKRTRDDKSESESEPTDLTDDDDDADEDEDEDESSQQEFSELILDEEEKRAEEIDKAIDQLFDETEVCAAVDADDEININCSAEVENAKKGRREEARRIRKEERDKEQQLEQEAKKKRQEDKKAQRAKAKSDETKLKKQIQQKVRKEPESPVKRSKLESTMSSIRKPVAGDKSSRTVTEVLNKYPYVIHSRGDLWLAASPLGELALGGIFSFLRQINAVEESLEEWHPLILAMSRKSGLQDPPPPRVVTLIKVRKTLIMQFRYRQQEEKVPYNVWYDPRDDPDTDPLNLSIKPGVSLYDHQKEALSRVIQLGHAGSGMVVLPCGAGKTLLGISLAAKLNKATLIICNSLTSIAQWQASIRRFCDTTSPSFRMGVFAQKCAMDRKDNLLVTTYSILGTDRGQAHKSNLGRMHVTTKKWGLVILDEVHVAPANMFKKALGRFNTRCIVGLTATPLREDDHLQDLPHLVAPMTYYEEVHWGALAKKGFLAEVQCIEVLCDLTDTFSDFLKEKMSKTTKKKTCEELIAVTNPKKLRCCQALMHFHEGQGDKVLIFCDTIFALNYLATELDRPCIDGSTKEERKIRILNDFRNSEKGTTILFSRVGDSSIDLPEASVILQVGAHFGSRCQETQRFGRVSRPKRPHPQSSPNDPQAYFYTFLTRGTPEIKFGAKRQEFLKEKGYQFTSILADEVVEHHRNTTNEPLILETEEKQTDLLTDVSNRLKHL